MLRTMSGLASGADAVQVIGSIAVPLVGNQSGPLLICGVSVLAPAL